MKTAYIQAQNASARIFSYESYYFTIWAPYVFFFFFFKCKHIWMTVGRTPEWLRMAYVLASKAPKGTTRDHAARVVVGHLYTQATARAYLTKCVTYGKCVSLPPQHPPSPRPLSSNAWCPIAIYPVPPPRVPYSYFVSQPPSISRYIRVV